MRGWMDCLIWRGCCGTVGRMFGSVDGDTERYEAWDVWFLLDGGVDLSRGLCHDG